MATKKCASVDEQLDKWIQVKRRIYVTSFSSFTAPEMKTKALTRYTRLPAHNEFMRRLAHNVIMRQSAHNEFMKKRAPIFCDRRRDEIGRKPREAGNAKQSLRRHNRDAQLRPRGPGCPGRGRRTVGRIHSPSSGKRRKSCSRRI